MLVWDQAEETEGRGNSICWSGMGKREKSQDDFLVFGPSNQKNELSFTEKED